MTKEEFEKTVQQVVNTAEGRLDTEILRSQISVALQKIFLDAMQQGAILHPINHSPNIWFLTRERDSKAFVGVNFCSRNYYVGYSAPPKPLEVTWK